MNSLQMWLHLEANCKGCYYKMQPTGFNLSLVQAPPSTDACLAKGAIALEV